ncbi:hypothetical protein [Streptomyces europaeiscabiei]|uniref:hypothetical protein n=1 Tax=Streptomyces europaeiscabiei TaxID=146819 RepID=UPI0029A1B74A|nr:hypothetical protein [Streptomyces europaeiscabiei]MDX3611292.1 hypothetical protein [Streptomyces europaeiscabiei]
MTQTNDIPDSFWNEVRGPKNRLPVWLPGTPMELGDVGRFTTSGWTKFTTLADLNVQFTAAPEGTEGDFEYASSDGVRRDRALSPVKADAGVASARGDVTYRFEREGAFVMRATAATVHRMDRLLDVEEAVLELYRRKKWRRDWVLVTEVVVSGPSLVLVSAGGQAEVTVRVKGSTTALPGVASASAAAHFEVEERTNMAAAFHGPQRTAVLWRGFHVVDPLFRKPEFAERGEEDQRTGGQPDLAASQEPYCEEVSHLDDIAAAASSTLEEQETGSTGDSSS